ncbi:unnamed protein product [Owenia fusiformis]|uniref:DUF268 domain-containing protein n=1 Tax=Owenia fusiformis TaxID=6347 RepID=A0A8S4PA08_OWEFU|nr:unnamed protein product [Owenia fusiformis]
MPRCESNFGHGGYWSYSRFPTKLENAKEIVIRKIQRIITSEPDEPTLECGEICSYKVKDEEKGKYYPFIRKNVKCGSMMKRMALNPATPKVPPKKIPAELYDEFTQNGELPNKNYWYINDKKSISKVNREKYFSKEAIEQLIKDDRAGKIIGTYEVPQPKKSIDAYKDEISNKRGVVIGSQSPWLEALALSAGAKHMTTLEYNNNPFLHPNITKIHPYDMAKKYANGSFQEFDFALSYSSIEHSGLGRYGDPLNPYGDLEAVAQVWCMLKPGGLFILGLPETHKETSYLQFNALRSLSKYGSICTPRTQLQIGLFAKDAKPIGIIDGSLFKYHQTPNYSFFQFVYIPDRLVIFRDQLF